MLAVFATTYLHRFFTLSHILPPTRFDLSSFTIQPKIYNYRLYENPTYCSRKQIKHIIWWLTNFPHNLSHNLNRTVSSLNSSESRCSLHSSSACGIRLSVSSCKQYVLPRAENMTSYFLEIQFRLHSHFHQRHQHDKLILLHFKGHYFWRCKSIYNEVLWYFFPNEFNKITYDLWDITSMY